MAERGFKPGGLILEAVPRGTAPNPSCPTAHPWPLTSGPPFRAWECTGTRGTSQARRTVGQPWKMWGAEHHALSPVCERTEWPGDTGKSARHHFGLEPAVHSSALLALRQQQEAISVLGPDREPSKPFYLITLPLAFISAALLYRNTLFKNK